MSFSSHRILLPIIVVLSLVGAAPAPAAGLAPDGGDECEEWQHRDANGNCADDPDIEHHHGHYEPHAGEQCWVECECYAGQYPAADSCAPCAETGTVCKPE